MDKFSLSASQRDRHSSSNEFFYLLREQGPELKSNFWDPSSKVAPSLWGIRRFSEMDADQKKCFQMVLNALSQDNQPNLFGDLEYIKAIIAELTASISEKSPLEELRLGRALLSTINRLYPYTGKDAESIDAEKKLENLIQKKLLGESLSTGIPAKWIEPGESVVLNGKTFTVGGFFLGDFILISPREKYSKWTYSPKYLSSQKNTKEPMTIIGSAIPESIGAVSPGNKKKTRIKEFAHFSTFRSLTYENKCILSDFLQGKIPFHELSEGLAAFYISGFEILLFAMPDATTLAQKQAYVKYLVELYQDWCDYNFRCYGFQDYILNVIDSSVVCFFPSYAADIIPFEMQAKMTNLLKYNIQQSILAKEGIDYKSYKQLPDLLANVMDFTPYIGEQLARKCVELFKMFYDDYFHYYSTYIPTSLVSDTYYAMPKISFSAYTQSFSRNPELEARLSLKIGYKLEDYAELARRWQLCFERIHYTLLPYLRAKDDPKACLMLPASFLDGAQFPELDKMKESLLEGKEINVLSAKTAAKILLTQSDEVSMGFTIFNVKNAMDKLSLTFAPLPSYDGVSFKDDTPIAITAKLDNETDLPLKPNWKGLALAKMTGLILLKTEVTDADMDNIDLIINFAKVRHISRQHFKLLALSYAHSQRVSLYASLKQKIKDIFNTQESRKTLYKILLRFLIAKPSDMAARLKAITKIMEAIDYPVDNIHSDLHGLTMSLASGNTSKKSGASAKQKGNQEVKLDSHRLKALEKDTLEVQKVLTDVFDDEEGKGEVPATSEAHKEPAEKKVETPSVPFWQEIFLLLSQKEEWSGEEVEAICKEKGCLRSTVLEEINDFSFEKTGEGVIEDDDDMIYVYPYIAEPLKEFLSVDNTK